VSKPLKSRLVSLEKKPAEPAESNESTEAVDLNEPDAFIETAAPAALWLTKHRPVLYAIGIALVVIPVGVVVARTFGGKDKEQATADLMTALKPLEIAVIEGGGSVNIAEDAKRKDGLPNFYDSDTAKSAEVTKRLKGFIDQHSSSSAAPAVAALYGAQLLEAGKIDEAIAELEKAKASPEVVKTFGPYVTQNLGFAYEAKGDLDKAASFFAELAAGPVETDTGLYHQGRILAAQKKNEEARKALNRLVTDFPTSTLKSDAERRLKSL
jgi:tetratricopeptide (TPR) repeat protein